IRIGWIGVPRSTPDYFPLIVLNTLLGGSFSSRLNMNLREKHGYTYGASSSFDMRTSAGPFSAGAAVQTDKTGEALKEFFNELDAIRKPVPDDEVARAKNYVALRYPGGFETTGDVSRRLEDALIYKLPDDYCPKYVLPPPHIVEAFDAEPLPQVLVSPNRQVLALVKARPNPTIAELSQPMLRLAGLRINPKTNGPHRSVGLPGTGIYSIVLKKIADGSEVNVAVPPQARVSNVKFSPDGSRLAFLNTKDTAIELWVADSANGTARAVTGQDRINAAAGDPCDWLNDNATLLCTAVPASRGAEVVESLVPSGPNVRENYGKAAPAPTYEDLLKDAHDDRLFEYY